eukprot:CAMPEP_0185730970 /NCGR_PEP_ID=MMETSP1171-20130828/11501_1 /TAXON_ID=374046 /ORGANISM="Helicotheca tamensis, Strain CCMP826" /LENGTH=378 /DNA_ID=CAMNT_0028400123 /DNA_START=60 /DNA_END=1196 /DNA_ORIENTATION=-
MTRSSAKQLKPHKPTFEAKLVPILRKSPTLAAAYEATSFNEQIGPYVAASGILPFLDRCDDFPVVAQTCKNWLLLTQIVRALSPACASDVRHAIDFGMPIEKKATDERDGGNLHDGEYELFYRGVGQSMTIYCHNVLSTKPTEFLTLPSGGEMNYSHAPVGGSCGGNNVLTRFSKLRINPWMLKVKTDDYTFAKTTGGPLTQTYWNGARNITLINVPYATARDSRGSCYHSSRDSEEVLDNLDIVGLWPHLQRNCGDAMIDLRGTDFEINDSFRRMGCASWGRLAINQRHPKQHLHIAGGGFAGRVAPQRDRTRDEASNGINYDDEGNNGGWCLALKIIPDKKNVKKDDLDFPPLWTASVVPPIEGNDDITRGTFTTS